MVVNNVSVMKRHVLMNHYSVDGTRNGCYCEEKTLRKRVFYHEELSVSSTWIE